MTRASVIFADALFLLTFITILGTGGLNDHALILVPLILAGFASCVIRHINYYNLTNRIY